MDLFIQHFHWLRPMWLLGVPLTLVVFVYFLLNHYRGSHWQQCIDKELLDHLLEKNQQAKLTSSYKIPLCGAVFACCLTLIALAGPSWEKLPEPPLRKSVPMIIIADLTLSMYAEDIEPSRLVRMRYKLLELLKQRKEGQTALIAYSGSAHIVSPLTDDAKTIAALVPALSPEIIPSIGSNAAAAFELAQSLIDNSHAKTKIVWFTDEAQPADQDALAKLLKRYHSEILIIGLGSKIGAPIPLPSGKFLKSSTGEIANSKLDKQNFQQLARRININYIDLQNDNSDITLALSDNISLTVLKQSGQVFTPQASDTNTGSTQFSAWKDRGAWLCLGLLPFTALLFRRGWLLSVLLIFFSVQSPELLAETNKIFSWQDLWQTPDQQAAKLRKEGKLDAAVQRFDNTSWRGVSAYENKDYQQALDTFDSEIKNTDANANTHYNHGHALAQNQQFEAAINAYERALQLAPEFKQAAMAKSIIEQLLKQQQDESQQDKDSGNSNSKSNDENNSQQEKNDSSTEQQENNQEDGQKNNQQNNNQEPSKQQEQTSKQEGENAKDENNEGEDKANEPTQTAGKNEPTSDGAEVSPTDINALNEKQQAQLQQWLNKIKDDPSGLLRRKFQYERQLREQNGERITPNENGKIW